MVPFEVMNAYGLHHIRHVRIPQCAYVMHAPITVILFETVQPPCMRTLRFLHTQGLSVSFHSNRTLCHYK